MTVKEACEEFLVYLGSVKGMSENTVKAYGNDLEKFCSMEHIGGERSIETVTAEDLRLCIGNLSLKKSKSTSINRFISSFRSLFAYCWKFGYLKVNPALEVKTIKTEKTLPNFLTGGFFKSEWSFGKKSALSRTKTRFCGRAGTRPFLK